MRTRPTRPWPSRRRNWPDAPALPRSTRTPRALPGRRSASRPRGASAGRPARRNRSAVPPRRARHRPRPEPDRPGFRTPAPRCRSGHTRSPAARLRRRSRCGRRKSRPDRPPCHSRLRLSTAVAWRPMANSTTRLTSDALAFLTERHLAMLTTLRADNSPHVVAVGFTFDPKTHIARVITSDGSQKAINAERSGVGVLSQVDGARWLSLEGQAGVSRDPAAVRAAELRYAQRYRTPRVNPKRVVIEVHVTRVLGSSG